jgi:3-hydroxyacyl-[acyl-carrier-protein] dehydratase
VSYVFVDRVVECEPGQRVVALKALAHNEEFFTDHFPGMPVLPGAMILEGFSQAARSCLGEGEWILKAVEQMRFNRFAAPGDVLRLEADRTGEDEDGAVWFKGRAKVGDEGVCRLKFALARHVV